MRRALLDGTPISWGFNPAEKRVVLTLPQALGGETHILCIAGSYTFKISGFTSKPRSEAREVAS